MGARATYRDDGPAVPLISVSCAAQAFQALSLSSDQLGWRASNAVGGDPGTDANPGLLPGAVVINELAAHVATPSASAENKTDAAKAQKSMLSLARVRVMLTG